MVSATRVPNNLTTFLRPMDSTDCLAPRTDRSYHLSPLAAPARPVRRTRRPADLLSGECRCARHPRARFPPARRHQLPGDAGNLVGERHRHEFWRLALQQGDQPRRRVAPAAPNLLDHRSRPRHQQAAQDLVTGAGDLAEPGLARGGMVFRCQSEPGRKVPAGGERARIRRLHHQRCGADRAQPRNLCQAPAVRWDAPARSVAVHLHAQYRAMLLDPEAADDEVAVVHAPSESRETSAFTPDSGQAWGRLGLALIIGSIGRGRLWSGGVVLRVVQAEFGASRGAVSLAFTLTMLGFGLGGVATGKITDRFGIVAAMALSIAFLGLAYVLAGLSTTLWQFIAVHVLIGLGTSATFGPLMAEASHWFERYRGLAVTIVASGNYVGGTIWPPLVNWGVQSAGWRTTHIAVGIFCAVAMTIMLFLLRAQIGRATRRSHENAPPPRVDLRISTNTVTAMLCIASIACCVAMAMPQVHIVAYCGDLGYGVARGAEDRKSTRLEYSH